MNEKEIAAILGRYIKAFPYSKIDADALVIYAQALSDFAPALIDAAMKRLLLTEKFFPAVSEIRDAAKRLMEYARRDGLPSAGEAWEEAMQNVRKNHVYKPWTYSCPEVEAAIRHFGKMELICLETGQVNTARAQFIRFYNEVVEQSRANAETAAALNLVSRMKGIEQKKAAELRKGQRERVKQLIQGALK